MNMEIIHMNILDFYQILNKGIDDMKNFYYKLYDFFLKEIKKE